MNLYINTFRGAVCVMWVKGRSAESSSKKRKARKLQKTLCGIQSLCIYANYVCIKLYTCKEILKEGRKEKEKNIREKKKRKE